MFILMLLLVVVNRSRFPSAVIGSSRAMTTSLNHATKNTSRNVAFAACGAVAIGSAVYFAADAKSGVDIAAVKEAILDIYDSNNDLGPFFVRLVLLLLVLLILCICTRTFTYTRTTELL